MSDLDMCKNDDCKKAQNCLRYLAIVDTYQSYLNGRDDCDEENDYKEFIEVKMLGNNRIIK